MAFYLYPGIQFDYREPLPPEFQADANHGTYDYQRRISSNSGPNVLNLYTKNHSSAGHQPQPSQVGSKTGLLAPCSSTIKINIVHDTAKFTVFHLFQNGSTVVKDAVFQFPLPIDATVTGFNCRIGNERVVRGRVDAKKEARHEFEEARRQGQVAGLLEQQTGEIFRTKLANIPANTKVRVEVSFLCLLKHQSALDHQTHTLILPTFISPRYGPLPSGMKLENQGCESLKIEVNILMTEEIEDIKSDTHVISWEREEGHAACQSWDDFIHHGGDDNNKGTDLRAANVQLAHGHTCLDRDLVISIVTKIPEGPEAAQACLETHPTFANHRALMLTIPGNLAATETSRTDREIVFVADRSGSMADKIERLKSAMIFFIKGIPEGLAFNIWCFGSDHASLWPKSMPLTDATMLEAISYVRDEFKADMRGTEILPVIKGIHQARNYDFNLTDVILLTDGQVWRPEGTINYIRDWRQASEGKARFFALGIGKAVSHELVRGIASAGGGCSEVVTSDPDGFWEDRVVTLLRAARTEHVRSIRIDLKWHGDKPAPKYKQTPKDTSVISHFQRNRVYMLLESETAESPDLEAVSVSVTDTNGVETTKRLVLNKLFKADDTIHLLAARGLLDDLDKGQSWLHKSHPVSRQAIEEEAVSIGRKWSLTSKWTSMYAIEKALYPSGDAINDGFALNGATGRPDDVPRLSQGLRNYLTLTPQPSGGLSTNESTRGSDCELTLLAKPSATGGVTTTYEDNTGSKSIEASTKSELSAMDQVCPGRNIGATSLLRWPAREMLQPKTCPVAVGIPSSDGILNMPPALAATPWAYCNVSMVPRTPPSWTPRMKLSEESFTDSGSNADDNERNLATTTTRALPIKPPRFRTFREPFRRGREEKKITDIVNTEDASGAENAISMIRKLLGYQKANGCFAMVDHETVKEALGPSFLKIVARLEIQLQSLDSAVTVAIIALLEQNYQEFHNLWVLMVGKAKGHIADSGLGHDIDEVIRQTKTDVKSIDVLVDKERKGSFTELEVAPTV